MGPDFVFQCRRGSGALKPSSYSGSAQHQQIAVPDADGIQPQALTPGFIGRISLVQLVQHVVEPALYADVKIIHTGFFQRLQIFIRLGSDVVCPCVHGDDPDIRQNPFDEGDPVQQMLCGQSKGVRADQINPLDADAIAAVMLLHFLQIGLSENLR